MTQNLFGRDLSREELYNLLDANLVMAFADDTNDEHHDQYFTPYVPVGGYKALYVFDTPEELLNAWYQQDGNPDGMWYWVLDHGEIITYGACDPMDEETIIDWFGEEGKREKRLWTCIYRDTIPGWPRDEDGWPIGGDNLCEVKFPERIIRQWFEQTIAPDHPGLTFEKWFWEESTADDTDGLFTFAMGQGYYPDNIVL